MDSRRHAMILGAALFAGGSLLTLVALVAPRSPQADVAGAWVVILVSALVAAVFWLGRDRLPMSAGLVGVGLGTVLISAGIYINGERFGGPAALNEVYYVWPVVFAAYYFPGRALAAELAFTAVCYACALALVDAGSVAVTRWLIVVTMLIGVGTVISQLQTRVRELVTRLTDSARRDVLTGLLNRRGFEEQLEAELARATRSERPVALILGDADHFKQVNDRLGHPAGDAALLRVAQVLEHAGRLGDTVARLGGEEFVFIAPGADGEEAITIAERGRRAVERAFANDPIPLTMSFGTVAFPYDGATADTLLAAADRALYAAKRGGRNRSERSASEPAAA